MQGIHIFLILLQNIDCGYSLEPPRIPIKWRQRPDMTIGVDLDSKPQLKQTNTHSKIKPINLLVVFLSLYTVCSIVLSVK